MVSSFGSGTVGWRSQSAYLAEPCLAVAELAAAAAAERSAAVSTDPAAVAEDSSLCFKSHKIDV